jgi:SNF2 family DNA or RNA helicase
MDVRIETKRLPARAGVDKPRISLETEAGDGVVWLMPLVVYGDPVVARVDQGELVLLGDRVPRRSIDDEQTLVHRLRDEFNLVPGRRVAFKPNEAAALLHRLGAVAAFAGLVQHQELVPVLDVSGVSVSLSFAYEDARGQRQELPGETVMSAFRLGLSLVPLPTSGFAPLPADWLSRHGAKIAELLASRDSEGKVHRALTPALLELCEATGAPTPAALREAVQALDMGSTEPVLPQDLQADLRQYQREGVAFLQRARRLGLGALLADDMGLGKTLQAIAVLSGPTLVVCPRSVLFNWERELQRFRPGLKVCLFHGSSRKLDPEADVVLTTYGTLRNELPLLTAKAWDTVVIDEAQTIKNPDSQSARAAFALHGAKFRVALSGTPVENRLEELFSITHFANPGLLGTRADFRALIGDKVERGDAEATDRLRRKLRPVLLRRTKSAVAQDLPPRTDSVLFVDFEEDERALYEAMRLAARSDVQKRMSEGASPMAALEALLRLRQAACHASLLPGQARETSSKVQRLVHALMAARDGGHRALVFSQWTGLLDLIEPALRQAEISFCRLDGSTRDRASVVDVFQQDQGPTAMLVSLKAGGTGLNLTAADHVFLLDPWWNPAAEDQAADRAHRIGQERPVMVHRLVTKDTVEERVLALQQKKREIAAAALEGSALGAQLTKDDLLALLD